MAILTDTSLAAIVKNELDNPAGGIRDFIETSMPLVEEGVVVDTGSVDGTREELEELQLEFPNLVVVDKKFRGFADARNESLKHVGTRFALVLDADERLEAYYARQLEEWRESYPNLAYEIDVVDIPFESPDTQGIDLGAHNVRFFELAPGLHFKHPIYERLYQGSNPVSPGLFENVTRFDLLQRTPARIFHYLPLEEQLAAKREWYKQQRLFSAKPLSSNKTLFWIACQLEKAAYLLRQRDAPGYNHR